MQDIDLLQGKELGKYKLHEKAGDGGQAVVYKAWHNELHAWVAVKFLRPELYKKDSIRERFKQEARLQFRLQHPHIVRVIEILEDGEFLGMVMDWVEGKDLDKYLQENLGPLPYREIKRIFLPVLRGVGYAHKQQIVHRDLKPSNILLHDLHGEEIPKVMDFGIAKSLAQEESQTKTGSVLGTPSYLAPEQARSTKHVDHRADIYALGITLYQMLSGRLPFVGEDVIQVIMKHITDAPPSFGIFQLHVPSELNDVVMKALSKDPNTRYSSCQGFEQALEQALNKVIQDGLLSAKSLNPTADSKPTNTLPYQQNDIAQHPTELLPSGELAPEENTALRRAPTLYSGNFDLPKRTSKNVLYTSLVLVCILSIGVIYFLSSPKKSANSAPTKQATQTTQIALIAGGEIPQPLTKTPHPTKLPNPSEDQRPTPTENPIKVQTQPQRLPLLSVPPTAPTKQSALPKSKKRSNRCFRCLQRFAKNNFGVDGMHPCLPTSIGKAARSCRNACLRNFSIFCRAYQCIRFVDPLGNKTPLAKMGACRANLKRRANYILKFSGYPVSGKKSCF
ncbi:MAG: protein kinase [Myxococcales bacterium]|nr:protein kinase [Myxococcales bacterium]